MSQTIVRLRGRWLEEAPGHPLAAALAPLGWCWGVAATLRNRAYDLSWKPAFRLAVPVVSVGNLVAGGSGKTPVARTVAETLRALGRNPAVLARGYRRLDDQGNDEARLLGGIPVFTDPDRVAAGNRAMAAGHDALVLDDGFQHRRLHRDLDILVLDATRPWGHADGGGRMLPAGYLREPRSGARRAGLAWITRGHLAPASAGRLRAWAAGLGIPAIADAAPAYAIAGGVPDGAAILVSGIGHPAAFEQDAAAAGVRWTRALRFPDHHHYDAADAAAIRRAAAGAAVVMTAKDAVKLDALRAPGDDWRVLTLAAVPDADGLTRLRGLLEPLVRDRRTQP